MKEVTCKSWKTRKILVLYNDFNFKVSQILQVTFSLQLSSAVRKVLGIQISFK